MRSALIFQVIYPLYRRDNQAREQKERYMMVEAIEQSLPFAFGIALSPLPIAAIIMMLMSAKARTNAPAFLLGWILGLLLGGIIVFMVPVSQAEAGKPTEMAGLIRIVLGILLLYFALIQWRSRPGPEDVVEVPKLLSGLDTLGTGKSLLVGFMLVAVNPKNLLLCMAGAAAIDLNTSTFVSQLGAYKIFILIASSTVIFPMIPYLFARKRAAVIFESWKDWLVRKNKVAMAMILLVLGIVLVYRGIVFTGV